LDDKRNYFSDVPFEESPLKIQTLKGQVNFRFPFDDRVEFPFVN